MVKFRAQAIFAALTAAALFSINGAAQGGGRIRGNRARTGVNTDSLAQKDPRIRAIDAEPTSPGQRNFCWIRPASYAG